MNNIFGSSILNVWVRKRASSAFNHSHVCKQETIACFLDPFTLRISASSVILDLKEGVNKIFSLCIASRK